MIMSQASASSKPPPRTLPARTQWSGCRAVQEAGERVGEHLYARPKLVYRHTRPIADVATEAEVFAVAFDHQNAGITLHNAFDCPEYLPLHLEVNSVASCVLQCNRGDRIAKVEFNELHCVASRLRER
jgi:hypothetical protein